MKLTADNVHTCFLASLFEEGYDPVEAQKIAVKSMGITRNIGFHPERIAVHKDDVEAMLQQIPNLDKGLSFLSMCIDNENRQWGEHKNVEELVHLGQALDLLECCLPREVWPALPGGMPYYQLQPKNTENNNEH